MMPKFEPFTLPSGIRVDDWDDDREGRLWGTYHVTCADDSQNTLKREVQALLDNLPAVNSQGTSRDEIKWLHLSGALDRPSSFPVCVFVSY
jgi:hypothetical protein